MEITLIDSLVLLVILAILLIGYGNRRGVTAQASRALVKDHLEGVRHRKQDKTMLVLRKRLALLSSMLTIAGLGVFAAFLAAGFSVFELELATKVAFLVGLFFGSMSILQAVRESSMGNKSHFTELDETISAHDPLYQASA